MNSIFFEYKKLNYNDFKEALYYLFYEFHQKYNNVSDELAEYLDFYYYSHEYVSSHINFVVYVFDSNREFIARISLLDFKFGYNFNFVIRCLFEEICERVPYRNSSFYLCLVPIKR